MPDALTPGLPVPGYRPQTQEALDLVALNKAMEERTLRILDGLAERGDIDPYWLKLGRAQIESGFMAVNRAVFRPERARLPEDGPPAAAPPDATGAAPAPIAATTAAGPAAASPAPPAAQA